MEFAALSFDGDISVFAQSCCLLTQNVKTWRASAVIWKVSWVKNIVHWLAKISNVHRVLHCNRLVILSRLHMNQMHAARLSLMYTQSTTSFGKPKA